MYGPFTMRAGETIDVAFEALWEDAGIQRDFGLTFYAPDAELELVHSEGFESHSWPLNSEYQVEKFHKYTAPDLCDELTDYAADWMNQKCTDCACTLHESV